MEKKHRSRTEIFTSVLGTAARENMVGITKLAYTSFLSYHKITSYLEILMKEGLLEYDELGKF